jgi:tetratricopeptide (TPR) repeat protein
LRPDLQLTASPDPDTAGAAGAATDTPPETQNAPPSETALATLTSKLAAAPLDATLHDAVANALRATGNESGALAHRVAVDTFRMLEGMGRNAPEIALYNLATVYYLKGDYASALRWFEHTLAIAPGLAIAHQNLAAVLDLLGRAADAEKHRRRAYELQRIYVEPAKGAPRRVLILCSGRPSGNVPFDTLLPPQTSYRIKYAIDCADEAEDASLPPFDLVFNAIGEPDIAAPLTPRLEAFERSCGSVMLNRPSAVAATQRHGLPALLAGLDDALTAPCIRLDDVPASGKALASQLVEGGISFPLLMRPLSTHGGSGVVRHASVDTLWPALEAHRAPCYLTTFRDYRSTDGQYRKYRVVFVDGQAFPYHLAISSHWMVHYFSAEMTSAPWKLEEERRFLEDVGATLGERGLRAVEAIGRRLALDYGGIDFTLLPDGRVLVFEANATMLVHREKADGALAHKNAFVQRIFDAFEQLQASRMGSRGQ